MRRYDKGCDAKKEKLYALRRKLNDFIEEDKKRRDRNVYILDRFNKMRSTVALLKSINNNIIIENKNIEITRNNDRVFIGKDNMLNYRENHVDESNILKEISQKYILIPRIYSINRHSVIDIKQSEDVNWRSKYNILDELKKKDREEPPEKDIAGHFMQKDSRIQNNNNFRSNNNNINSLLQDSDRYNVSLPNKNISSNYEVRDDPTSSILNSSDLKADSKLDEYSNVQNDYKLIYDSKQDENSLNVNKDSKCFKEAQVDISTKAPEINYSVAQDSSIKIFKEHEIPKNDYDSNTQVTEELHHETKSHLDKENHFDKNCEDNGTSLLPPNILPEVEINETDLGKYETEQQGSFYLERNNQNVENSEIHQNETLEIYANDNNTEKDQFNNYYKEPQLQQETIKIVPYNNVSQESQKITGSHNQNYEHGDSHENQSTNYESYEAHNNYPAEDQNYEYQNIDQQNSEYISSNNQISSEPTQETNRNLNENEKKYAMYENGIEFEQLQQQQLYDQQNYIDSSHDDIQQPYIDNEETIPENNASENVHTTNQEETYDVQNEYNAQNQGETEQEFEVGQYLSVRNENENLQHDYNNQNFNEIYQDNQGAQELVYDYAAQGQEIQQHDGLGYSEQHQDEFLNYDEGNGLNSQNEIHNLQDDYGNQNIDEIYQEGNLQASNIQDNVQYDYTPKSNELQHNDVNNQGISEENNYVES